MCLLLLNIKNQKNQKTYFSLNRSHLKSKIIRFSNTLGALFLRKVRFFKKWFSAKTPQSFGIKHLSDKIFNFFDVCLSTRCSSPFSQRKKRELPLQWPPGVPWGMPLHSHFCHRNPLLPSANTRFWLGVAKQGKNRGGFSNHRYRKQQESRKKFVEAADPWAH